MAKTDVPNFDVSETPDHGLAMFEGLETDAVFDLEDMPVAQHRKLARQLDYMQYLLNAHWDEAEMEAQFPKAEYAALTFEPEDDEENEEDDDFDDDDEDNEFDLDDETDDEEIDEDEDE